MGEYWYMDGLLRSVKNNYIATLTKNGDLELRHNDNVYWSNTRNHSSHGFDSTLYKLILQNMACSCSIHSYCATKTISHSVNLNLVKHNSIRT